MVILKHLAIFNWRRMMEYWEECISEAAEGCGLNLTDEQLEYMTEAIEGAHECYGMAFGHDAIPNPVEEENKKLKKELEREQNKVICRSCNGSGTEVIHGPLHTAYSDCCKCRGKGFIYY
jgi:hypothetical protein